MQAFIKQHILKSTGAVAFIVVVGVGYAVGIVAGFQQGITPVEIGISAVLTLIYLYLGLNDNDYFARYDSTAAIAAYFIIMLSLAFTIQLLLGAGGSWLIGLPLVGTAVVHLKGIWRWFVYFIVAAGIFVPVYLASGLENALFFTLSFSPAMVFVNVFTKITVEAETARQQAETLAIELEAANHQLADYATQVEELATTQERNRLAREIHDNLGHYLTIVNVQIKVAQAVMETNPAKAQDALQKAQRLTQEGLISVRQSVASLRESPMGNRTLPEAIRDLLAEIEASGLVTEFILHGQHRPLDSKTSLTLYRIAQEGLTNIRKHARASRVNITLEYTDPDQTRLTIEDNGIGMAPTSAETSSFGLLGIHERIKMLNGRVDIQSAPGEGVTLVATVPG